MECFTLLFMGMLIIAGAAQFIDWLKKRSSGGQYSNAQKTWYSDEYINQQNRSAPNDMDFLAAILLLEMADDGCFLPDGQQVFERLDHPDQYQFEDQDYFDDEYYADYHDQDGEYLDHWGLG